MGEVYRARDTKLGRDVAVKILPEAFTRDPERVARFQREAQILAALNHPHIASIYGLEEANGSQFLVLELVEGETLAEHLVRLKADTTGKGAAATTSVASGFSRTQGLPIDEALKIARQIADALEAAHEKGIIHRDLKPANVALTADGQVKVLDFGLAKFGAGDAGGSTADLAHSPTLTFAPTQVGMILGTAAYMAPEQAKGRVADKRCDVWAFGCVLFEMLTGKKAFEGEDVSDTLAAILRGEPDWNAIPKKTPAHIRTILTRCLKKDRKQRLADLSVALFLMDEPASGASVQARGTNRRVALMAVASLAVAAGAIGVAAWQMLRGRSAEPAHIARYAIVPPAAQPLNPQGTDRDVAITPDGTHIVYRGGTAAQLMVRAIDQLEAVPLRNTEGARQPFISPDGHWVGFFTGNDLKKVSMTGGPAVTLCPFSATPRGASWGSDDTIVFATSDPSTGLLKVSAGGGEPKVLTTPDAQHGERDHFWPTILPGGQTVLFTITAGTSGADSAQVAALDLKSGAKKILIRGGSDAQYVNTGHLVYGVEGTLRAVRFDLARLDVLGDPVPAVEQVMTTTNAAANFSVSQLGTLVYVPGAVSQGATRSLVWVNRQGREEPIKAPPRGYAEPRISPDGKRVALDIRDQESDIWILDLGRETLTRLTFGSAQDQTPVWTPDGRRIVFASQREGPFNIYSQASDGSDAATAERLTKSQEAQYPWSISPDGARLVFSTIRPKTQSDIDVMALTGDRRAESLLQTNAIELNGDLSPDGRWLAYQSNESGTYQVYVRPFPNAGTGGRWQVSTSGGTRPAWARSGRELFYKDATGLLAVSVQTTGQTFTAGNPTKLFDARYYAGVNFRTYDVSPDGQRFLMVKEAGSGDDKATPASMVVVEHWFEDLKQKLPVK